MKDARYHAYMIVYEFEISNKQLKSIRDSYYKKNNIPTNERNRSMVLSNEVVRWKKKLDSLISLSLNKSIKSLPKKVLCILRLGYYELIWINLFLIMQL